VLDPVVVGWRSVAAERFDLCHDGSASEPAGLACDGASTRAEQHKGLHANIVNKAGGLVEVPRLKLLFRNTAEQVVYSWTAAPPSHRWPPGQTIAFARWLASPSARSSDVLVRFRNRGDPFADPR
jgi:hypothetical protein